MDHQRQLPLCPLPPLSVVRDQQDSSSERTSPLSSGQQIHSSSLHSQPRATAAERATHERVQASTKLSSNDVPTATAMEAGAELQYGMHTGRSRPEKAPVLASVWLDADRYTYEALCTAGAASITVASAQHKQAEETEADAPTEGQCRDEGRGDANRGEAADQAGSSARQAASWIQQLMPHEATTRKRLRGHTTGKHAREETKGETCGEGGFQSSVSAAARGASVVSENEQPALPLQPGDADARLDVLEEVELCSIIPRLSRTFGVKQLVQQLVPCTAYMSRTFGGADDDAEQVGAVNGLERHRCRCSRDSPRCLERLREAADLHHTMLCGHEDILESLSPLYERGEGSRASGRRQPIRHVSAWLSPVPGYMKSTSQQFSSDGWGNEMHCRDDGYCDADASVDGDSEGGDRRSASPSSTPHPQSAWSGSSCTGSVEVSCGSSLETLSSTQADGVDPRTATTVGRSQQGSTDKLTLLQLADDVEGDAYEPVADSAKSISAAAAPVPGLVQTAALMEPSYDTGGASGSSSNWNFRTDVESGEEPQRQDGTVELCFSFAAAQALYERQRRLQPTAAIAGASSRPCHRAFQRSRSPPNTSDVCTACRAQGAAAVEAPDVTTAAVSSFEVVGGACGPASSSDFLGGGAMATNISNRAEAVGASVQGHAHGAGPTTDCLDSAGTDAQRHNGGVKYAAFGGDGRRGSDSDEGIAGGSAATRVDAATEQFWASAASYFSSTSPADPFSDTLFGVFPFASHQPPSDPAVGTSTHGAVPDTTADALPRRHPSPPSASAQPTPTLLLHDDRQYVAHPAGAIVEWASGVVSYSADTDGLMQEQRTRSQRFFFLPPPSPTSAVTQGNEKGCGERQSQKQSLKEDRSTLRGAVLSQLQRLQWRDTAATAYCHGGASRSHIVGQPPLQAAATAASAQEVREVGVSGMATRAPTHTGTPQNGEDPALCRRHAQTARTPSSTTTGHDLPCACHHCSPLQLQFAQVPSMTSSVLLRYLGLLHQTALPNLQKPYPTPRRPRTGEASDLDAIRAGEGGQRASSPSRIHSGRSASSRHDRRGPVDPIDFVFPTLEQWFMQVHGAVSELEQHTDAQAKSEVAAPGRRPSSNSADKGTRRGAATLLDDEGDDRCGGASGFVSAKSSHADSPNADSQTTSLDWIDDAVLDEAVVVGVMPRGQPHQLRLVAPSYAFVLALTQRLEGVCEVALRILTNISLPACVTEACRSPAPCFSAECASSRRAHAMEEQWQAWLEDVYLRSVWGTLHGALTLCEWCAVVQRAAALPFLPSPSTLPAADADDNFPLPAFLAAALGGRAAVVGDLAASSCDDCAGRRTSTVVATIKTSVRRAFNSVRSAAVAHTTACLSAAEDASTRIILTALTPLLHRRITVMYELLRHFASKSLYASHRDQCESYQRWYATTPSPGAVLRLLQRSRRFRGALARCYPQYALLPLPQSPQGTNSGGHPRRGELSTAAFSPAHPLACTLSSGGGVHPRGQSSPADTAAAAAGRGTSEESRSSPSSSTPWSPVSGRSDPLVKDGRQPGSALPSSSTSTAAVTMTKGSMPPSHESPTIGDVDVTSLKYVPEVALLDPRYLQRFAWWTHRTYHGSGNAALSSGGAPSGVSQWHSHRPVMSIPGDYLRVLPLQEQDAGVRTVLRSMAQKGRTLDLWEMSQHIQAHRATPYVYR
ncbi:hypothetical protein ABL78_7532 [Leptomonas seymouri]|uniref:Uncharacterized protein n=1 Tax=Leptomonas seymouri TaxID=5684 RepID=A0A0N1HZF3_LEPSE|nr:hypothetical protein ABL78_7532 [Leptomonas seymouri]|eukprot:KPI83434.1 hypothetical protein ABL78_7532 [Leptomonas seymouri]